MNLTQQDRHRLAGIRNSAIHCRSLSRALYMMCSHGDLEIPDREALGAVADKLLCDLMDLVDDMDKALGEGGDHVRAA